MSMNHSALFPFGVDVLPAGGASTNPPTPAAGPQPPDSGIPAVPTPTAGSPGAGSFVKWGAAMVALWFILTALYEYGGAASQLAPYLAGLILFGVLYYQGPKALQNLQGVL